MQYVQVRRCWVGGDPAPRDSDCSGIEVCTYGSPSLTPTHPPKAMPVPMSMSMSMSMSMPMYVELYYLPRLLHQPTHSGHLFTSPLTQDTYYLLTSHVYSLPILTRSPLTPPLTTLLMTSHTRLLDQRLQLV